jgi:alkanesulfonate monooxygenase SsuD/methylene tetrahydromethanopterin reductase-like flavin-dependent oxidoreductase (luciferase family)
MSLDKRIAVTLPFGPKIEQTIELIRWAEDNGITDGWFSDAGGLDSLTQVAAIAHHTQKMRIGSSDSCIHAHTRSPGSHG